MSATLVAYLHGTPQVVGAAIQTRKRSNSFQEAHERKKRTSSSQRHQSHHSKNECGVWARPNAAADYTKQCSMRPIELATQGYHKDLYAFLQTKSTLNLEQASQQSFTVHGRYYRNQGQPVWNTMISVLGLTAFSVYTSFTRTSP